MQQARRQGVEWRQAEGAKHDTFWLGSVKIPRHAEIGQRTTEDILQARPGGRGLSAGASRTTIPSWPPSSAGRVPVTSGRSSA
jgi:hypothetical protein